MFRHDDRPAAPHGFLDHVGERVVERGGGDAIRGGVGHREIGHAAEEMDAVGQIQFCRHSFELRARRAIADDEESAAGVDARHLGDGVIEGFVGIAASAEENREIVFCQVQLFAEVRSGRGGWMERRRAVGDFDDAIGCRRLEACDFLRMFLG